MEDGKKAVATKIVYQAIDSIQDEILSFYSTNNPTGDKNKKESVRWFISHVINRIRPTVEVVTKRIGGSNYQIPSPVRTHRALSLALRWLVEAVQKRSEKTATIRLAKELSDIMKDRGETIKKLEMVHKTAEANRAFAHLAK